MIINIDGEINLSYVQNLCLIFFPGEKFSDKESPSESTPVLDLRVEKTDAGCYALAKMTVGDKTSVI